MQAIAVENPGPDYRLVLKEQARPEPGGGEVLIKVAGAGLNHADLLQAKGHYPPPPGASDILGMEVSGTIAALDPDAFLVARRVASPDTHRRPVPVGDEREPEGREHRLRPRAGERRRAEVQSALVRPPAGLILQIEPRE